MEVVLLLTGCIKPNVDDKIAVSNWKKRQDMYVEAISWYAVNTNYKIVFVENSGTDVSDLIVKCKNVDIHTFTSIPDIPDRSRSYKEMQIMEYAFKHSPFLQSDNIMVVKITGRLKLLNINQLVNNLLKRSEKYNNRFVSSAKNARKPFSDCRFMYFTKDFWPILHAQKENIWPTYGMEWVMGDAIREATKKGIKFVYPPYVELIEGIGMSSGASLRLEGKQLLKQKVKHAILKTLFNWGIMPMDGK